MTNPHTLATRCLVLACGNTLRTDDGVGPYLAAWLMGHYAGRAGLRILARQQWTPDLAEDLAHARTAIFIDCSMAAQPGELRMDPVEARTTGEAPDTHHLGAAELLALSLELYGNGPGQARLFTIGAASLELGETFSAVVEAALPAARTQICATIEALLLQE
jgi:hydrogenase maturation protease